MGCSVCLGFEISVGFFALCGRLPRKRLERRCHDLSVPRWRGPLVFGGLGCRSLAGRVPVFGGTVSLATGASNAVGGRFGWCGGSCWAGVVSPMELRARRGRLAREAAAQVGWGGVFQR